MKWFNNIINFKSKISRSNLLKNSFWGVSSNLAQNILFSLFFIILARSYSRIDFADYIIANSLYGMAVSFSSLGLGQWFIREVISTPDRKDFMSQYFKLQFFVGIIFYLLHILLAHALYKDQLIRNLSLLLGINIVFDNIIYVLKHVNVADENQRKTFIILTIEAVLKLLVGCVLLFTPIAISYLCLLLIFLRLVTLNIFMHYGSSGLLSFNSIFSVQIKWSPIIQIVRSNWPFIIIGSLSVIYWRIGNVFVSKFLELDRVADYEVSFKLFSIAEILPFIISTSIFPYLVKAFQKGPIAIKLFYTHVFYLYSLYGLLSYTFIISYSDFILPQLFGPSYQDTATYCNQMFLAILIFPTALLQANILVSMKLEKIDMWLNLISLLLHVLITLFGLYYFNSLSVVSYSIFFSFIIFHFLQDIILIRKNIITWGHALFFYVSSVVVVGVFYFISLFVNIYILYPIFWSILLFFIGLFIFYLNRTKNLKFKLIFTQ